MSKAPPTTTKHNTKLSRALSRILRHKAKEVGLTISSDGFVPVDAILTCSDTFKRYGVQDIQNVVALNDKQRFCLAHRLITRSIYQSGKGKKQWKWKHYSFIPFSPDDASDKYENQSQTKDGLLTEEVLCIRANQGHSIEGINPDELLTPLSSEDLANMNTIIHGTYRDAYANSIRHNGLNRMKRNHIHFASGFPGENGVISGMRKSCEIYIFLDTMLCAHDGVPFYKSDNGVILTPGATDDGSLPVKYFDRVVDAKTKELLYKKVDEEDNGQKQSST